MGSITHTFESAIADDPAAAAAGEVLPSHWNAEHTFSLTKSDVGLSNVDNTSDANKPVSTATQTALDLKANLASPTFTGTVGGITNGMVGLGNVTNDAQTKAAIVPNTVPASGEFLYGGEAGAYVVIPFADEVANIVGSTEVLSNALDSAFDPAWGEILFRGENGWVALAAGTAGQYLRTNGVGANPEWDAGDGFAPDANENLIAGTGAGATLTTGLSNVLVGEGTDVAAGDTNEAVVFGKLATAALRAIAVGRSASASGSRAMAFGHSAVASGDNSIAMGWEAEAPDENGININGQIVSDGVDLKLIPVSGLVSFGTYTADTITADGYIAIKAADGTTYHLLVRTPA